MEDKFVLNSAENLFNRVNKMNAFERYDLMKLHNYYNEYKKTFKNYTGREPFIYDLIEIALKPLDKSLRKSVKQILFGKKLDWFMNVGQYFFYNLYDWTQKLDIINQSDSNKIKFLKKWWKNFINYENEVEIQNYEVPEKILLELTNNCNLNCIMCGIGKYGYNSSRNMSLDLLNSLKKDLLPIVSMIRLNGLGESTIIPNFIDYLDILRELPAKLEIVTNLTVQNNKIWQKLIEINTNFLISCDSSNPKVFESIRRGSKFEVFEKNMDYIGNSISNPMQAQIIFTLMEQNINELLGVIEFASKKCLGGVIVNVVKLDSKNNLWIKNQYHEIINVFKLAYELAKSYNINLKLPDHMGGIPVNQKISTPSCRFYCENSWKEVYIRYNGDLTVCNMLNPYIYGNCKNYPFNKIWNGLNAYMFRSFVNNEFRHYYCQDCYYMI